jgi:hypothetical protein
LLCWLYRETICFYLFLKAASNNTVKWREGTYRLKWGGLSELVHDKQRDKLIINENVNNGGNSKLSGMNHHHHDSTSITNSQTPLAIADMAKVANGGDKAADTASIGSGTSSSLGIANKKPLSHKRTSSYSVIMKSSNSMSNAYNSDVENSACVPLLRTSSPQQAAAYTSSEKVNNNNNQNYLTASKANLSSAALNQQSNRSQPTTMTNGHHHHHSISSPLTSSSNSIQLSKKFDI